jgi:predicted CXXCH cytochrome family protein
LVSPVIVRAGVIISSEAEKCLVCHAKHGLTKVFENNKSIEAYVDAGEFMASVHKELQCSECHTDFSAERHPKRRFRNSEQYKIQAALACKRCHTNEQLKTKSIHAAVLDDDKGSKTHTCTNCHGSHSIMPVSKKIFKSEEQHCLKCHGQEFRVEFKNGDALSLKVEMPVLQASVHKKLSCSDCHFGFSHAQHPQRNFRSRRDFFIASSETCRRCHFDKYTKSMEGIHYAKLSQGNLEAPVCTDCHGSHAIVHFGSNRTLIAQRCGRCHPQTFDVYAKSVHGNALFDEHNQDVPVCIDCHTAHNIQSPLSLDYRERIPDICSNCHANKAIMDKYGLSTDVVKSYLSDFHGVTLSFYKKQREKSDKPSRLIAVCTDCHGTHNISSTRNTDPAVVKANLVKRCQVCHKDAARNFPDTWLSHYEATLASAPLVFMVSLMYKIFTPVLAIGIILQILLHIWRYAVNR